MKISEIKKIIKEQIEMDADDRIVLCLVGQQGIGKTQAIQQVAKENGWKYKALYGAQAQVEDLMGIPIQEIYKDSDEKTKTKTNFAEPVFFPTEEKTIFVLEEINRAQLDVQQAVLQLLTDKQIGPHKLPNNCLLIISINPSDGNIYNVDELDPVFINRICRVNIDVNTEDWIEYAITNNFHDQIVTFINNNEKWLSIAPKENNIGESLPSPRTWEFASKILKMVDKTKDESNILDLLSGVIGKEATAAFIAQRNRAIPVKGKEIVEKYNDNIKNRLIKQNPSETYYTRVSLIDYLNKNKIDNKDKAENVLKYLIALDVLKSLDTIATFIHSYGKERLDNILGYDGVSDDLFYTVRNILNRINVDE